MAGATDLARKAFAKMTDAPGDDEGEGATEEAAPSAAAVAGKRFAAAVQSGDGEKIAAAFKRLKDECETESYDDAEEME